MLKGATKDIAQATKGLMELQKVTTRTNSKGELEVVTKLANAYGTVAKVVTNTKTHQSTVQWDQDFKKLNSTLDNTGKSADTAADGTKKVSDGVKQAGNEAEKPKAK